MKKIILFSIFISISCTTMKKNDAKPAEEASLDFNQLDDTGSTDATADVADIFGDTPQEAKVEENSLQLTSENVPNETQANTVQTPMVTENLTTEEISEYVVQENETLMLIAFKIYGDYEKWKNISKMNKGVLKGKQRVTKGMVLKYKTPVEKFVWSPEGNPYLIHHGDTLGSISHVTYGTKKHWKDIWNNNKPMIKNPNKIFAGFTLYTPILKARDVAFSK